MQNPMVKISGDCKKVPLRCGWVGLYIQLLASVVGVGGNAGLDPQPALHEDGHKPGFTPTPALLAVISGQSDLVLPE